MVLMELTNPRTLKPFDLLLPPYKSLVRLVPNGFKRMVK